jgi:hypothetical protein
VVGAWIVTDFHGENVEAPEGFTERMRYAKLPPAVVSA